MALINLKLKAFPGISSNFPWNLLDHSPDACQEFRRIFNNIPRNLLQHSPESLITFPGIFQNIPLNLLEHFPESSRAFSGMLKWEHSPESSKRFPRILVDIPRVPCIPRIPFPVPVFLVLDIAGKKRVHSPFCTRLYDWFFKSLFFAKLIFSIVPIYENLEDPWKMFFPFSCFAHASFTVFSQRGFYRT